MNSMVDLLLVVIVLVFTVVTGTYFISHFQSKIVNCNITEISPDVSPNVREQCRQLRQANK
jgi:uncharacterized protein YneF (UPF0154 family)